MKVRFTPRAQKQLDTIYSYISERNPSAAQRVKARIREVAEQLGHFPFMARGTDRAGVRVRVANPYPCLIFYRIRDDEVHILDIRHGARRPLTDLDE
jgi:plasmid stabilization system protein ParE